MRKKTSKLQPLLEKPAHRETQESFRQNLSFAEKILDVSSMFPTLNDDHDIRKVTREKVEIMLYAEKLLPEMENIKTSSRPGPQGINRWIWENKVQYEIPQGLLREFLSRGMRNSPHVYYRKYQVVRMLLLHISKYHEISPAQVQNEHLLDPTSLQHAIFLNTDRTLLSPFHLLIKKSA
ncbi:hypothetical protein, partial [Paenibacillus macerans]|uniref:hypothetical protein n=1 Tax=Paenibacillus macerans TaxID=44252 RepID=UPI003D31A59B